MIGAIEAVVRSGTGLGGDVLVITPRPGGATWLPATVILRG